MLSPFLHIHDDLPKLTNPTMLLALSGWMDGGSVSTGTVKHLMSQGKGRHIAEIDSDDFYIFNFPGSMEMAALFRPEVRLEKGITRELEMPSNDFYCNASANLLFFIGREPNLKWEAFADALLDLAAETGTRRIIFIGSFGGSVPHTREPRLYGSVSDKSLRRVLKPYNVRMSDYEGPGSFSTYLLTRVKDIDAEMMSLVAEIPGYLQGVNPLSIEAVTRRLARLLNITVNMDMLREASNEWEAHVTEVVQKDEDLTETVRKLEEQYDNELIGLTDVETSEG